MESIWVATLRLLVEVFGCVPRLDTHKIFQGRMNSAHTALGFPAGIHDGRPLANQVPLVQSMTEKPDNHTKMFLRRYTVSMYFAGRSVLSSPSYGKNQIIMKSLYDSHLLFLTTKGRYFGVVGGWRQHFESIAYGNLFVTPSSL